MSSTTPPTPTALNTFLTTPAPPTIRASKVDFTTTPLPQYSKLYASIIDDALSQDECETLLSLAEATTSPSSAWEPALVNTGGGNQSFMPDVRKCGRIIWDTPELATRLWERIAPLLDTPELSISTLAEKPQITGPGPTKRKEVYKMTRLNERMRFLRYEGGDYFAPHCDGSYITPDGKERSYMTLHLYLCDPEKRLSTKPDEKEMLQGGATSFLSWREGSEWGVPPKMGRVLVFQHHGLMHAGEEVLKGVKYTMRTDVMYRGFNEAGESI